MTIKDFIPPILIRLLKGTPSVPHDKEYDTYDQALQDCTSDAYQDKVLCNMMADITLTYKKTLNDKPHNLNAPQALLLSAIDQYLNRYAVKNLTILDFGGACGAHYFEVRRFLPEDVTLQWRVLETAAMAAAANDRGLGNDELRFDSSFEASKDNTDFVVSSGALQYVPDPYGSLERLIAVKPNWLFFNRMMFNENDRDFITVQRSMLSSNGPGKLPPGYADKPVSYPHTTMSFPKFNRTMVNHGYAPEWQFDEASGTYAINHEKIMGRGLLYLRK